jgi:uncharacterized membrane protein HdeD (DUF308 family)
MGAAVIIWPENISGIIGTVCAIVLIIIGAVYLGSYVLHVATNGFSAAMGAVILLLGVWVLLQPGIVLTLIPIVIGVILAAHGIRGLREALAAKQFGADSWKLSALFAIISIALGVVCIVDAFGVVKLAFWIIGIALIYNGISNIFIAVTASRSERKYRRENGPIDLEFNEDK